MASKDDNQNRNESTKKDDGKNEDDSKDMKSIFEKYTEKAGNKGKILLEDAKKWFEEANISKKTEKSGSDVDESSAKSAKEKESMNYEEFKTYIQTLAKDMKVEGNELINKLVSSQKGVTEDKSEKK